MKDIKKVIIALLASSGSIAVTTFIGVPPFGVGFISATVYLIVEPWPIMEIREICRPKDNPPPRNN